MLEVFISLESRHGNEGPEYFVQGNRVTESAFLLLLNVLRIRIEELGAGPVTVAVTRSISYGVAKS